MSSRSPLDSQALDSQALDSQALGPVCVTPRSLAEELVGRGATVAARLSS